MHQMIVKKAKYIESKRIYVIDCQRLKGSILPNSTWQMARNPHLRIRIKQEERANNPLAHDILYFTVDHTNFDLDVFQNTVWNQIL